MILSGASADRITALVLFAVGLAMAIGGYTMDRLEFRDIHPASIPGLLPMILGVMVMVCAGILYRSALFVSAPEPASEGLASENLAGEETAELANESWKDLVFTAIYCVAYALVLVGNMPFAVATAIFIAVFTTHFSYNTGKPITARFRSIATVLVFAVVCAWAVSTLFQYGFLVRLP